MDTMQSPGNSAGLTIKGERWIRVAAVLMTVIVAGASAILSWNGLRTLGLQAGFPPALSWLLPISVDGMLFLGSTLIIHSSLTRQSTLFGWVMTGVGIVLSIFGNLLSVPNHDVTAKITHAIPAVMLALSVEALVKIIRTRISEDMEHLASLEQEARREAKRLEREAQAQALKDARAKKDSKALLSQSKRGGKKVNPDDPEVSAYRDLLSSLPAGVSKIGKVEAILTQYPEARTSHIALSLGSDVRSVGTTVSRAKAKLLREDNATVAGEQEKPAEKPEDAFEAIVSNMK